MIIAYRYAVRFALNAALASAEVQLPVRDKQQLAILPPKYKQPPAPIVPAPPFTPAGPKLAPNWGKKTATALALQKQLVAAAVPAARFAATAPVSAPPEKSTYRPADGSPFLSDNLKEKINVKRTFNQCRHNCGFCIYCLGSDLRHPAVLRLFGI